MRSARFRWFILTSLAIHAAVLWLFGFVLPLTPKPFSIVEIGVFDISPSLSQEKPPPEERVSRPAMPTGTSPSSPSRARPLSPSIKSEAPSSAGEHSGRTEGTSTAPGETSLGGTFGTPGSEGTSASGDGSSSSTGGKSTGPGGASTGTKGGFSPAAKDASSTVEIPSYVIDAAGFQSRFDSGSIYPVVDVYVLHGADKQIGIPVPGNEVCIEGDQLRTKAQMTLTEVKTDYSKCRVLDFGNDSPPKIICPPEAETRIIHSNAYASSPLVYSVRTCLEYDRSNCYDAEAAADGSKEVCRIDFQYDGIWAEGTIFAYKCAKSETRIYRHPLQYTIRYMVHPGHDSDYGRFRPREIYRESVPLQNCP